MNRFYANKEIIQRISNINVGIDVGKILDTKVGNDNTTLRQALIKIASTALQLWGPIAASQGKEPISWRIGAAVAGAGGAAAVAGLNAAGGILMGLIQIGKMNALGRELSVRNAWKDGFSATLAAMAENRDWTPTLGPLSENGRAQMLGRNAAVIMVKEMGVDAGSAFLTRYEGPNGRDIALKDIGGYRI